MTIFSYVPVLSQPERILVSLLAQSAHEVADLVLDLGQLRFGLLGHLHHVKLGINIA